MGKGKKRGGGGGKHKQKMAGGGAASSKKGSPAAVMKKPGSNSNFPVCVSSFTLQFCEHFICCVFYTGTYEPGQHLLFQLSDASKCSASVIFRTHTHCQSVLLMFTSGSWTDGVPEMQTRYTSELSSVSETNTQSRGKGGIYGTESIIRATTSTKPIVCYVC